MSRPLVVGLIAEDDSDCLFPEQLIIRQVDALLMAAGGDLPALVRRVVRSPVPITAATGRVQAEAAEAAVRCHVFFVHSDWNERDKARSLAEHVRQKTGSTGKAAVVLVPRKETEAWMIADASAFRRISGAELSHLPAGPKQAEKVADPKKTLKAVMAKVRHNSPEDYFDVLARDVDLAKLAQLPAYDTWVSTTRLALKELHFL
ncbi:DUF4276 family protein [Streptomyces sp. SID3343]|uniref:DUF4276 family protein n=1 Tax=Streptomyces sp. SID3343 TaxID=2690260 RepID=UPI00136ED0D4|nr:DUF4276 family protein [Streptomyces sp. SID3343]MYV99683.1 DUF4276 family protein [Streptomyces sp. SID3343]